MCGVFGRIGGGSAGSRARAGLLALQHRGQESCGIAVLHGDEVARVGAPGLVCDADFSSLPSGGVAVGHVRYATTGDYEDAIQPLIGRAEGSPFALAHNGEVHLREEGRFLLARAGVAVRGSSDSALLIAVLEATSGPFAERVRTLGAYVHGAYALVIAHAGALIGARDAHGVRPLFVGTSPGGACVIASEPIPAAALGDDAASQACWSFRPLGEGEVLVCRGDGATETSRTAPRGRALCSLETIYFAHPNTVLAGELSVADRRFRLGEALAREAPAEVDAVVPVPDSGFFAARGFASALGVPLQRALLRTAGSPRTFLLRRPEERARAVRDKLSVAAHLVLGKRLAIVDDSVVRGTTSATVAAMLREAGARSLHLRLSSPPLLHPCFLGVDLRTRDELAAARHGARLAEALGYDSVGFLPLSATRALLGGAVCDGCFSGHYPGGGGAPRRGVS